MNTSVTSPMLETVITAIHSLGIESQQINPQDDPVDLGIDSTELVELATKLGIACGLKLNVVDLRLLTVGQIAEHLERVTRQSGKTS
jgi:acyl carrier protein